MYFLIPEPTAHQVVVLYRRAGQWEVVFPERAGEVLPVTELDTDAQGRRVLELAARPEPGVQRWAVLLPSLDLAID